MKDLTIGVIGGGTVGRAIARCYLEHVREVRIYDYLPERATHTFFKVIECDLIFICLPESTVDRFFDSMVGAGDYDSKILNWVLKSTVPIGTTRYLGEKYGLKNLVHSPEFLTERCAMTDSQIPARNIVGRTSTRTDGELVLQRGLRIVSSECERVLYNLYLERFPGVPIYLMRSDESEAVKLFCNAFFAIKISFFNEINNLIAKLELDWNRILEGMLSDGRIGSSHTRVPGPDGQFGFGGKCLPKDLRMLIECITEEQTVFDECSPAEICKAALRRNQAIDRKEVL